MNWRERITDLYKSRAQQRGIALQPRFYPAATADAILRVEANLHAIFPTSLRTLLSETDGMMESILIDGQGWIESMWLTWSIEEIEIQNRYFREKSRNAVNKRDFRDLVFFTGAGANGILFAFPVEAGRCAPVVVVWHPIEDRLDEVAPTLEDFLREWLTGGIGV